MAARVAAGMDRSAVCKEYDVLWRAEKDMSRTNIRNEPCIRKDFFFRTSGTFCTSLMTLWKIHNISCMFYNVVVRCSIFHHSTKDTRHFTYLSDHFGKSFKRKSSLCLAQHNERCATFCITFIKFSYIVHQKLNVTYVTFSNVTFVTFSRVRIAVRVWRGA